MDKALPDISFKVSHANGKLYLLVFGEGDGILISGGLLTAGKKSSGFYGLVNVQKINQGSSFLPWISGSTKGAGIKILFGFGSRSDAYVNPDSRSKKDKYNHVEGSTYFGFLRIYNLPLEYFKGLDLGYGHNRMLKFPDFSELDSFPLLPSSSNNLPEAPSQVGNYKEDTDDPAEEAEEKRQEALEAIQEQIESMSENLFPKEGVSWAALGVEFGFSPYDAIALVVLVRWGEGGVALGLLGNLHLGFPKDIEEQLLVIDINFEIDYDPEESKFQLLAKLSKESYLKIGTSKVKMTGGIAVVYYTGGDYAKQLFVSLGPIPYIFSNTELPTNFIPPLSVKYEFGELLFKGSSFSFELYYINNPKFAAFGGKAKLVVAAHFTLKKIFKIGLQLALKAGFDLLISATGDVLLALKVSASASFRLKIGFISTSFTFELGIKYETWNIGGETGTSSAMDYSFGKIVWAKDKKPKENPFEDFKEIKGLLPHYSTKGKKGVEHQISAEEQIGLKVVDVNMSAGVIKEYKHEEEVLLSILDPFHFEFSTETTIPANEVKALGTTVDITTKFYKYTPNQVPDQLEATDTTDHRYKNAVETNQLSDDSDLVFIQQEGIDTDNPTDPVNTPFLNVHRTDKQMIGLAPMGIKIRSTHTVTIEDWDGNSFNHFLVRLNTKSFPLKIFGNQRLDTQNPSNNDLKTLIAKNALNGLTILPPIPHAAKTKTVLWYLLIFDQGQKMEISDSMDFPSNARSADYMPDTTLEDLEQASSALDTLKEIAPSYDYFQQLGLDIPTGTSVSLWDAPLDTALAEEVNQVFS